MLLLTLDLKEWRYFWCNHFFCVHVFMKNPWEVYMTKHQSTQMMEQPDDSLLLLVVSTAIFQFDIAETMQSLTKPFHFCVFMTKNPILTSETSALFLGLFPASTPRADLQWINEAVICGDSMYLFGGSTGSARNDLCLDRWKSRKFFTKTTQRAKINRNLVWTPNGAIYLVPLFWDSTYISQNILDKT